MYLPQKDNKMNNNEKVQLLKVLMPKASIPKVTLDSVFGLPSKASDIVVDKNAYILYENGYKILMENKDKLILENNTQRIWRTKR